MSARDRYRPWFRTAADFERRCAEFAAREEERGETREVDPEMLFEHYQRLIAMLLDSQIPAAALHGSPGGSAAALRAQYGNRF